LLSTASTPGNGPGNCNDQKLEARGQKADGTSARPDFSILVYPVSSFQPDITHVGSMKNLLGPTPAKALIDKFSNELQVNAQTPPAFLLHAQDDTLVPIANSISYYQAMKRHGVPGELHIYEKGGHGFGLNGSCSHWTADLIIWMKARGLL
jgi:acetyl esterase/lipase